MRTTFECVGCGGACTVTGHAAYNGVPVCIVCEYAADPRVTLPASIAERVRVVRDGWVRHGHTYSDGDDVWAVKRLWVLSAGFPVVERPVDDFPDWEQARWSEGGAPASLRDFAEHMARVRDADPRHPILVSPVEHGSWIMDGAHRLVRARLDGEATVPTRQFPTMPPPDWSAISETDVRRESAVASEK